MATRTDYLLFLSGGLSALLDGPAASTAPTATNNLGEPRPVEQTPPEPQLQDTEVFRLGSVSLNQPVVYGGAIILAVVAALYIAKKF